mmetsp:Transcript_42980/g.111030  ORF Transcript_42980/g.111030 Transcript_42980/m.111030 type:complete len:322 (-) Transcript_42980:1466-2431(-)
MSLARLLPLRSYFSTGKFNFPYIHIVPKGRVFVVERLGKKDRELQEGLHFTVPLIDRIAYGRGTRDDRIQVKPQSVITKDNIEVFCTGVIYYRIVNVEKSCYRVEYPEESCRNLAESVMRKEAGNMELDELLRSRNTLNTAIREGLREIKDLWGIDIHRYEVQSIEVAEEATRHAMREQSDAERKRRAAILKSEGEKIAEINSSEANKISALNHAEGEANSILMKAEATAKEIQMLAEAERTAEAQRIELLAQSNARAIALIQEQLSKEGGEPAARLNLSSMYVKEISDTLGKAGTVIVPNNPLDVRGILAQAESIWKNAK